MSAAEFLVRYALVGGCWLLVTWRISRLAKAAFATLRERNRRRR